MCKNEAKFLFSFQLNVIQPNISFNTISIDINTGNVRKNTRKPHLRIARKYFLYIIVGKECVNLS
jgi:hypothetical protein